jgi:hypothetical protein
MRTISGTDELVHQYASGVSGARGIAVGERHPHLIGPFWVRALRHHSCPLAHGPRSPELSGEA